MDSISVIKTDQLANNPILFPSRNEDASTAIPRDHDKNGQHSQHSHHHSNEKESKKTASDNSTLPSINLHSLHSRISSFMETLWRECSHPGTYWVFKQSGDDTINVVDLESMEDLQDLSEEDRIRHLIRTKQLQLDECHRYIEMLEKKEKERCSYHSHASQSSSFSSQDQSFIDTCNTTKQYLLIQAISVLTVCSDCYDYDYE